MSERSMVRTLLLTLFVCAATACGPRYPAMEDKLVPQILLEPRERPALRPGVALRAIPGKGVDLTKLSEGFVSKLYHDVAGYCTIAYGHLLDKGPCTDANSAEFKSGITEPRGAELLLSDMSRAQFVVLDAVEQPNELTDGQFGALCDFVYNAGGRAFRSSTLLKRINEGRFDDVPTQLRRWVNAGGKPWPGLVKRREREIDLFFEGLPKPRVAPGLSEPVTPLSVGQPES
jgi:lysozyme